MLQVLPLALVAAALCALISRVANFEPGYVYGLFAGYAVVQSRMLTKPDVGRAVLFSVLCVLGVGLLIWIASDPIQWYVKHTADPGFGDRLLYAILSETFMLSVQGVAFALIPLRFLDGHKLMQWSRGIWIAVYGFTTFVLVHVLLLKQRYGAEPADTSKLVEALALFIGFGMLSIVFWAYFRFRPTSMTATPRS